MGQFATVHLTVLPTNVASHNPYPWVLVPCYRKVGHALRGALGVLCLQPSWAAERSRGSYCSSCLSGADWHKLLPSIAWLATEPEQNDSAEVVNKSFRVFFMMHSLVLLIISVLFFLLVIWSFYSYRGKTVSPLGFQSAWNRGPSLWVICGHCHRATMVENSNNICYWSQINPIKYTRILTILHKLDGCVKTSNIDIQLSNKSAVPSTITDCAWCNTKEEGFIYLEAFVCVCMESHL